jgi:hypothetical protein
MQLEADDQSAFLFFYFKPSEETKRPDRSMSGRCRSHLLYYEGDMYEITCIFSSSGSIHMRLFFMFCQSADHQRQRHNIYRRKQLYVS